MPPKAPGVTNAKRIRALLDSAAERQKKQEARLDLRKRIRDHGSALTERMDKERMRGLRADNPVTARVAHDMAPPSLSSLPSAVSIAWPPSPPPPGAGIGSYPSTRSSLGNPPRSGSVVPMSLGSGVFPRAPPMSASSRSPMSTGSRVSMHTGSRVSMNTGSVLRVNLSPRSCARSASSSRPPSTPALSSRLPSTGSSVSSLVGRFQGLGYPGGRAPSRQPPRAARDLVNNRR